MEAHELSYAQQDLDRHFKRMRKDDLLLQLLASHRLRCGAKVPRHQEFEAQRLIAEYRFEVWLRIVDETED